MRKVVACLLVVLVLGICSPVSLHFASTGSRHVLVTLDVCHGHSAAVSANADLPAMTETPVVMPAVRCEAFLDVSSPLLYDLFTPYIDEDPPKA
ncbi:MAG: hypothetical protein OHK006_22380 [Thermodesulfovibrionales bacterium]